MESSDIDKSKSQGTQRKNIKDSDEMVYVKMDTFGVTSATHQFPILRTTDVSFCVAVALWDPESKVAGLAHITPASIDARADEPHQGILNMLKIMQANGMSKKTTEGIQAHVPGGFYKNRLGEIMVDKLKQVGISNIVSDERTTEDSFNFAIDSRTGEILNLINLKPLHPQMRYGLISPKGGLILTSDPKTLT